MKFVTDLGKGILGTADSTDLWSEIIDHIPDDVLTDPNTKILNVACGHLTESRLLVKRMMDLGVTAQEANSKIYVLDKYSTFTNAAKMQGYQNVIQTDFLEWKTDMKFDVVLGNPPYQSKDAKKAKLWFSFLEKGLDLVTDDGYLSYVTPDVWVDSNNTVAKKTRVLMENYHLTNINFDADQYFDVGESICSFQISKGTTGNTEISGGVDTTVNYNGQLIFKNNEQKQSMSICEKIISNTDERSQAYMERFEARRPETMTHYSEKQTSKFKNPAYYSSVEKWFTDLDTTSFQGEKIVFNNSGYYFSQSEPNRYMWRDNLGVALGNTFQIRFKSKRQADNALKVYRSKLYQFFVKHTKSGGFNASCLYNLPYLDFTKTWTDKDLYTYFSLTQDEIEYVEANY